MHIMSCLLYVVNIVVKNVQNGALYIQNRIPERRVDTGKRISENSPGGTTALLFHSIQLGKLANEHKIDFELIRPGVDIYVSDRACCSMGFQGPY